MNQPPESNQKTKQLVRLRVPIASLQFTNQVEFCTPNRIWGGFGQLTVNNLPICNRINFPYKSHPKNSRRKPCPVLRWANNDGTCGRRSPPWRRCCVLLGDVVLLPRLRVAVDAFHRCFLIGCRALVWLPSPSVVPSHRRCLWRVVVAWGGALGWG